MSLHFSSCLADVEPVTAGRLRQRADRRPSSTACRMPLIWVQSAVMERTF